MQREIRLLRYWNNLSHAQNLKTKFEFQTLLEQNSPACTSELIPFVANSDLFCTFPAGTSELLPFGAISDLPWDWIFPEIFLGGYTTLFRSRQVQGGVKQGGIPEKESPGIADPKGDLSWSQTKLISRFQPDNSNKDPIWRQK